MLPLFSGCNDSDDVAAIFTGKTWKLNYITVDGGHEMFGFWENEEQEKASITTSRRSNVPAGCAPTCWREGEEAATRRTNHEERMKYYLIAGEPSGDLMMQQNSPF